MNIINKWSYEESVSKVKQVVYKWGNMPFDIIQELYLANKSLDGRDGRNLPNSLKVQNLTFTDYCNDIGIVKQTACNWLDRYIPEDNKLLTIDEFRNYKKEKEKEDLKIIFQYKKTEIKPEGWKRRHEDLYKRMLERIKIYINSGETISRKIELAQNLIKGIKMETVKLQRQTIK